MTITNASEVTDLSEAKKRGLVRGGPQGSPFEPWAYPRLFTGYGKGTIFDTTWDVREVEKLLETDGNSRKNQAVLSLPIMSAPWEIRDAPGDQGEGAFARKVCSKLIGGLIARCTSGFATRKVFHELCWAADQGRTVLSDIAWRPAATCDQAWHDDGSFDGYWQRMPPEQTAKGLTSTTWPGWKHIEQPRSFVYIHGRHRQPVRGVSDLDVSLHLYEQRKKLTFLLYQFLELQSVPRVVARAKSFRKAEDRADGLFEAKAGGIVPVEAEADEDKLYEVVESSGHGVDQFLATIRWLESQQTQSVLASFIDLADSASSGRGSYALSADQSQFFLQNRQGVADELAEQITAGVLRPLVALNFGPDAAVPSLKIGPISEQHIARAYDLLKTLIVAPNVNAPDGFVDTLMISTAQYIGQDVDEIRELVENHRLQREAQQNLAPAGQPGQPTDSDAQGSDAQGSDGERNPQVTALAHAIDISHHLVSAVRGGQDPHEAMLALAHDDAPAGDAPRHERRTSAPAPDVDGPTNEASDTDGEDVWFLGDDDVVPDGEPLQAALFPTGRELALTRHVRTAEGSRRYGLPIGSPIPGGRGRGKGKGPSFGRSHPALARSARGDIDRRELGASQVQGRAHAILRGRDVYVSDDGHRSFEPPADGGWVLFSADGTAWRRSPNSERVRRVREDRVSKLVETHRRWRDQQRGGEDQGGQDTSAPTPRPAPDPEPTPTPPAQAPTPTSTPPEPPTAGGAHPTASGRGAWAAERPDVVVDGTVYSHLAAGIQQAGRDGRERYVFRGSDGRMKVTTEAPDGTHIRVGPHGYVFNVVDGKASPVSESSVEKAIKPYLGVQPPEVLDYQPPRKRNPEGVEVGDRVDTHGLSKNTRLQAHVAMDAIARVHSDGDLDNDVITENEVDPRNHGSYTQLAGYPRWPDGVYEGDVIRAQEKTTHGALTFAHELGHYLDRRGLGDGDTFLSHQDQRLTPQAQAMSQFLTASRQSRALREIGDRADQLRIPGYREYLESPHEMWARAYSQFIAVRSQDPLLMRQLERERIKARNGSGPPTQWEDDDFGPVADAVEAVLRAKGWMK